MPFISILIALLWPFYQLSELPLDLPFRLYAFDLLILIAFFKGFKSHPLLKPILLFTLAGLISLLTAKLVNPQLTLFQLLLSSLYLIRFLLYASLLISKPKIKKFLKLSFFLIPLIGLTQYLIIPDLRFLIGFNYDDHYYRLTFPFLDPNYTSAALVFITIYSLKSLSSLKFKLLLTLSLIALGLTFSRAGYLSLLLGLTFLLFNARTSKFNKIYPLLLLILALTIFISPKPFGEGVNLSRLYSISSRITDLQSGLSHFSKNPLTGVGFNTLKYVSSLNPLSRASGGLTNSFIFIIATTGLLGLSSFIYLISRFYQQIKTNPHLTAALFALLIHSLFNNTLFFAPLTILIFLSPALIKDNT